MPGEPVTRADLDALEQRFEGKLDAVEQRILDRVGELIRDSETRLLQAFYGFAEATNKRFNQIDGNVAIFINRLGTLESRILELEKRLNIPPAA
ncbi:MAG TPA: hypothetical protein VK419_16780 [Bryobacteraceae bacterium]|nr:hypothetical protein [Bryobacteraceae bacterium]